MKIDVSTPDLSRVVCSHRAKVEDATGLCDLTMARKSLCFWSPCVALKIVCCPLICPQGGGSENAEVVGKAGKIFVC